MNVYVGNWLLKVESQSVYYLSLIHDFNSSLMFDIPSESKRVDWWDDHEPVILSSWPWIDKKLRDLEDAGSSKEIRNQLLRKYQIQSTRISDLD